MKILRFGIVFIALIFSSHVWSDGDWYSKAGVEALEKSYSSSDYYDDLFGLGVYVSADYLEKASFIAGYNYNKRQYKSGLTGAPSDMRENIVFMGASSNYYLDSLPGKLTLRVDAYVGQDKYNGFTVAVPGPMGGGTQNISIKDNFNVLNPTVAFLNHAKTFYVDLGYAYSTYKSNDSANNNINITHPKKNIIVGGSTTDDITVTQWTPTIGFGFNRATDWLQFRSYLINYSSSNRVDYKDSTNALETKWIHWFSSDPFLGLESASLIFLTGERIYAVDSDSYSLYNFADVQKSSLAMSAKWKLESQLNVILQAGYENNKDIVDNNNYSSSYLFAQLSMNW
jgi:hypothetical protein